MEAVVVAASSTATKNSLPHLDPRYGHNPLLPMHHRARNKSEPCWRNTGPSDLPDLQVSAARRHDCREGSFAMRGCFEAFAVMIIIFYALISMVILILLSGKITNWPVDLYFVYSLAWLRGNLRCRATSTLRFSSRRPLVGSVVTHSVHRFRNLHRPVHAVGVPRLYPSECHGQRWPRIRPLHRLLPLAINSPTCEIVHGRDVGTQERQVSTGL